MNTISPVMLVSLLLPMACSVGLFLLGRLFIRNPQAPTRFFTVGKFSDSRFGFWWFRITGYLFCGVCVVFWLLTPLYFIVYSHQHP